MSRLVSSSRPVLGKLTWSAILLFRMVLKDLSWIFREQSQQMQNKQPLDITK